MTTGATTIPPIVTPSVLDWHLLDDPTATTGRRLLVVPSGDVGEQVVLEHVAALCDVPLDDVVAIRRIPRDDLGLVSDEAALRRVANGLRPADPPGPRTRRLADRDAPEESAAPDTTAASDTGAGSAVASAEGPILPRLPDDPRTVVEAIDSAARRFGDRGVRVVDTHRDTVTDYATLLRRGRRILSVLNRHGLSAGDDVVLAVGDIERYVSLVWAAVLGGIRFTTVPAPTGRPDDPALRRVVAATEVLGPVTVVTDDCAADAVAASDGPGPVIGVEEIMSAAQGAEPAAIATDVTPDTAVALVQSSGSTGTPKLIAVTHRAVVENAISARAVGLIAPGETSFNWLPFDHVPPLVMYLLRDVVLGCDGVHAPTDHIVADPLRWLEIMQRYRVNHSWSANFGYRLVADALAAAPHRRYDLGSVRTLLNAGEQCTAAVVDDFLAATAPFGVTTAHIVHMWGMAETATGASCKFYAEPGSRRHSDVAGWAGPSTELLSMGRPTPGSSLRIVDDTGAVTAERTIGHLQASGARITPGYLGDPERTAAVMTDDGWFDTGDLAFMDDGEIVITGRTKDTIVVHGDKIFCHTVEDVVNAVPGVRPAHAAAIGVPDQRTGSEALVVVISLREESLGVDLTEPIRRAVLARTRLTVDAVVVVDPVDFPFTTGGKIRRSELVDRAVAGVLGPIVTGVEVPDCLFTPGWTALPPRPAAPRDAGRTVVFAGSSDVGWPDADLVVRRASRFLARRGEVWLDPDDPLQWDALAGVVGDVGPVDTVVYLWSCAESPAVSADDPATRVLLRACGEHLVAAIRASVGGDTRLVTVSRQAHAVTGGEQVCFPAAATAAITATRRRENPGTGDVHIDLPAHGDTTTLITASADAATAAHADIAWRDGRPHVRSLTGPVEPVDGVDPLRRGGRYIVVGGAGGVGRILCADLGARYDLDIVTVGRTPDTGPAGTHRVADVCDTGAMRQVLRSCESAWGAPVDGIIHLADHHDLTPLADEDPHRWRPAADPKTTGVLTLLEILADRPDAHLVVTTSMLGSFPASGCARYAAGNAVADAISDRVGPTRMRAVSLSLVDGTGVNRDNPYSDHARRRGFHILRPSTMSALVRAALRSGRHRVAIGVDASGTQVRSAVVDDRDLALPVPQQSGAGGSNPSGDPVAEEVCRAVVAVFARVAGTPVGPDTRITDLGLSSVRVVQAHAHLESALDRPVDVDLLFETPDLHGLAAALS